MLLVPPPGHHAAGHSQSVALRSLRSAAWATAAEGTAYADMFLGLCRGVGGFEPTIQHRANDFQILLDLAAQGHAAQGPRRHLLPALGRPLTDPSVHVVYRGGQLSEADLPDRPGRRPAAPSDRRHAQGTRSRRPDERSRVRLDTLRDRVVGSASHTASESPRSTPTSSARDAIPKLGQELARVGNGLCKAQEQPSGWCDPRQRPNGAGSGERGSPSEERCVRHRSGWRGT